MDICWTLPTHRTMSKEFGRLDGGPKASAFPQVRVVDVVECGTHAAVAASFGPCKADERALLMGCLMRSPQTCWSSPTGTFIASRSGERSSTRVLTYYGGSPRR